MGRLPPGSTPPEATLEARARLASGRSRRPGRPAGRGPGEGFSERERAFVADRAVSGATSADVDATIVFIRERSPAGRCASESLVAKAVTSSARRPRRKQSSAGAIVDACLWAKARAATWATTPPSPPLVPRDTDGAATPVRGRSFWRRRKCRRSSSDRYMPMQTHSDRLSARSSPPATMGK
jgi:hypothetical protein